MSDYRFRGIERVTIELEGSFDPAACLLPAGCEHDGGRVSIFAFAVEGLRVAGVPLARWSYPEILWRIAIRHRGEPAWWVIACDLEARVPQLAARYYVRYDVRPNAVDVAETHVSSRGEAGRFTVALAPTAEPAAVEQRPLRTGRDAGWLVPWGDDATPAVRAGATIETDTLSAATVGAKVSWHHAVMRRGREHRCGVARR